MTSDTRWSRLNRALGLMLYGTIGAVPYLGSPLVTPFPAAVILWVCWIVGLVLTIRSSAEWPWAAWIGSLVALLFWVLFVQTSAWLFGWTA